MNLARAVVLVAVALVAVHPAAQAGFTSGLINVDFNFPQQSQTQTGAAVIGAPGDFWNPDSNTSVNPTGVLNLASGNVSNGVTIAIGGVTNITVGGGNPFDFTPYAALMSDGFIVGTGNTMTLSIRGLTTSQPYDLYLYSIGLGSGENRTTTFTIAGNSRSAHDAGSPSAFAEGVNYVHFGSQPADGFSQINITIQGSGGSPVLDQSTFGGIINGFQITPVPEPAAIFLVAVAVFCVAITKCAPAAFCRTQRPDMVGGGLRGERAVGVRTAKNRGIADQFSFGFAESPPARLANAR
jgi:hypothetical protein